MDVYYATVAKMQMALETLRERAAREDGQGGIEYTGVFIAGALIVVGIVTLAATVGDEIVAELREKVDSILNAG